jgi:hypothetical protein
MRKPLDVISSGRGKASVRHAPLDAIGGAAGKLMIVEDADVDPWDKIAALRPARKQVPDNARTIREYAKTHGIGKDAACRELNELVASGVLDTDLKIRNGHLERLYWPT